MKSASAKRKIVCKAKAVRFEGKKSEVTGGDAIPFPNYFKVSQIEEQLAITYEYNMQ